MKLLENKANPRIVVNANGRILQMNASAMSIVSLDIGGSVFDMIDADIIRKISMHKKKMELVRTRSTEYPCALLRITTQARAKRISVTLQGRTNLLDDELLNAKRVFSLYTDKNLPKTNTCIDVGEQLSHIFAEIATKKEFLSISVAINIKRSFYGKLGRPQAELLFVTTAVLASEINPFAELEVLVDDGKVSISFDSDNGYSIRSMYDLLKLYPQGASRALLIQSICEDEFIEACVIKSARRITISYTIPKGNENELIVKANTTDSCARISAFIDTLLGKK